MNARLPALMVALLLAVTGCSSAPVTPASPAAPGLELPGPARVEAGVPVGYPHTADGARAAAVRYVAVLGGRLMLDPTRRDPALAAVSPDRQPTPDLLARWSSRPNVERVTGVVAAEQSGAPLVAVAAPVLSKVTGYDASTATVAVWATAVLGTERLGTVDQSWSTETLTLRWAGDWKLAVYRSTPGPVPALRQPATPLTPALAATAGMAGSFDAAR